MANNAAPNACVVLSCEHATARVPPRWRRALDAQLRPAEQEALQRALASHAGVDFGALQLARQLGRALAVPVIAATHSRLLVDCNRSPHHPAHLSPYARRLAERAQRRLVAEAYLPHRRAVMAAVATRIARYGRAVHLAVHSFTPRLHGKVRAMDFGVLYDPARASEARFATELVAALAAMDGAPVVRRNAPYRGTADGLPTALRKLFARGYVGIELEVNQAWPLGPAGPWRRHREEIVRQLACALQKNF